MRPVRILRGRRGYALLVALLVMALLAVLGATTLQVAGIDQRIAVQNRKHMLVLNSASAGTEHARRRLMDQDPFDEGLDTAADTAGDFVEVTDAESDFGGLDYGKSSTAGSATNLGVYWVKATFVRCGNPPPGYSTELGTSKFRSDYWNMESTARMMDSAYSNINETQATASALLRKVKFGTCKIR
jgi:type II secretory pathway pseudopilin PulG